MKQVNRWCEKKALKIRAIFLTVILMVSTVTVIQMLIIGEENKTTVVPDDTPALQKNTCEVSHILTESGTWEKFDLAPDGTPAEAHITVSDTSGITIVADFHGFWSTNQTINGISGYDRIDMPGTSSIKETGKPALPRLTEFVEVPHDIDIALEILSITTANISGYNVTPALAPLAPVWDRSWNIVLPPEPTFFDPTYNVSTIYPENIASTTGASNSSSLIMRGHRLVELSIFPVQFYPELEKVQVYSQIIVKLKYSVPAQIERFDFNPHPDVWDNIFEHTLLDYEWLASKELPLGIAYPPTGKYPDFLPIKDQAEYLIITHYKFKDDAYRLAEWKKQKGLLSKVIVVNDGITASQIETIIRNAYFNWYPRPSYVLLIGDCEYIPTQYPMIHEATYNNAPMFPYIPGISEGYIASDLPYFAIDGEDYFPDMLYGRISVDTVEEARTIVDKILIYEKYPPEGSSPFFNDILAAAFFEDATPSGEYDGVEQEQTQYIYYSETIRKHLEAEGYNVHVNYSAEYLPLDPYIPKKYANGEDLSEDLLDEDFVWIEAWRDDPSENYYPSLDGAANITANINDGRFLIFHFDHGGSKNMVYADSKTDENEGWAQPCFNTTNHPPIYNGNNTPLIISISCNTGWFDGERDQDVMGTQFGSYNGECLSENLTRMAGGAIAVIAATRASYNIAGGDMLWGIMNAFWPGLKYQYDKTPVYNMGAALHLGKMHVAKEWTYRDLSEEHPEQVANTTYQIFHLYGDPETELWTDVPSYLTVDYPDQIGTGPQQFVVTVTNDTVPVSSAKVCLEKGNDEYMVGYTDALGQVVFNVHPGHPGLMNLTVTAHNFVPHIGAMECVCGSPILTLTPDSGSEVTNVRFKINGFFENEDVNIYYESNYVTTLPAGSVTDAEFAPTIRIGLVNVIAEGADSNLVAVALYRCYSSDAKPDPYIHSQWSGGAMSEDAWDVTSTSDEEMIWDNPDITIHRGLYQSIVLGDIIQTEMYNVWVNVHNQGETEAVETTVTLWSAPIGGGVSWTYEGEYEIASISVDGSSYAILRWQPDFPGEFCLKVEITNSEDRDTSNNVGVLAVDVVEYASPGTTNFIVGNPTDYQDYVTIVVRQQGNYSNIWNAIIMDYSSQALNSSCNETVSLQIDPGVDSEGNESRMFNADIYVNGTLQGGISFIARKIESVGGIGPTLGPLIIIVAGGVGALILVAGIVMLKKRR